MPLSLSLGLGLTAASGASGGGISALEGPGTAVGFYWFLFYQEA